MRILVAILIFSLIILFHEFGHFLLARRNGIVVEEFSLGMGPRLWAFQGKETRYSVRILPFGGACFMKGEDLADLSDGTFGSKSVWARISVVAAGPVFNFILAWVCAMIIIGNIGYDAPVILGVSEGFPAEEAGLRPMDEIVSLNGRRVHFYREISDYVTFHQESMSSGRPVEIEYLRDGELNRTELVPADNGNGRYIFGISGSSGYRVKAGFTKTVKYGALEVKYWIGAVLSGLRMIFSGGVSLNDVAGPVGVVDMIGETYEESRTDGAYYVILNLLNITVLLSANLGVMNLLPLPALDGGRLLFLLVEAVRRKRISQEVEGRIHLAGMALLMALMMLILFNDIRKLL